MPLYYFHLRIADQPILPDDEGLELQDDAVARIEAAKSLADLIAETMRYNPTAMHAGIEIVRKDAGFIDRLDAQIAFQTNAGR